MKFIKSSLFNRAPKLLSSSIKMVLGKDIDSVVSNISELKGVPQKLGQLLSMDVTQYIPSELKEKLKPLQGESVALDHDIILNILKNELGEDKFLLISNFEKLALGAGSIGQVHRAQINGRDVVFKIQYPGIEKSIHADMAVLGPVTTLYEFIRPDSKDFSIILKEAKSMLLSELDYAREKNHQIYFRDFIINDERFYIPEILSDFSTEKIIGMEYIEGEILNQFIKNSNDKSSKAMIATAMLELFINEFFLLGKVQTDPNFANYLIRDNKQIILLDFGAVKDFNPQFRNDYFKLLEASFYRDEQNIIFYGEKLGVVDMKDRPEAILLYVSFMKEVMSYFHKELNPIDFKNEEITKNLLESGWKLWKEQRMTRPDSNLVFLHRKLGGLFSLLKEMEVEIDLYPFWEKIVDLNKK